MNGLGRFLVVLGAVLILIGLAMPWLGKIGLGRLPGDIVIERENFSFYFPITTSILVSLASSAILWWLQR